MFLAAGQAAVRAANAQAGALGDTDGQTVRELTGLEGRDLRSQEQAADRQVEALRASLRGRVDKRVAVFVELGSTAGALLVLTSVVREVLGDGCHVSAVVVRPAPVSTSASPDVLRDLDLLGQAVWMCTLDGRLDCCVICGEVPPFVEEADLRRPTPRKFGSRLYGE